MYSGRRVLITGASRGVGAALTEWLADNGAHVLAVGRSTENLSRSRVEYLALDLSSQTLLFMLSVAVSAFLTIWLLGKTFYIWCS